MANEKKFLDQAGVEFLWSKINMQDYPNNETLMAVITAIDETKADKRGTNPYTLWDYSTSAGQENYTPITSDNFTELITESLELNDIGTIGVLKSKDTIIEYGYITTQQEEGSSGKQIPSWYGNNFSYDQKNWHYIGTESFDNLSFIIYPIIDKVSLPEDIAYINIEDNENIGNPDVIKTSWLNDKQGNKFAPKTLASQVQTSDGLLLEDIIVKNIEQELTDEQKLQIRKNIGLSNVEDVQQYSINNPPPYPVISVNEKTGIINLTAADVGADSEGSAAQSLLEAKSYADTAIAALVNSAPETLDTLGELATAFEENADMVATLDAAITNKAEKSDLENLSNLVSTNITNIESLQAQILPTSLILADAITGVSYTIQIQNGQLVSFETPIDDAVSEGT